MDYEFWPNIDELVDEQTVDSTSLTDFVDQNDEDYIQTQVILREMMPDNEVSSKQVQHRIVGSHQQQFRTIKMCK